jgi:hypothetical protein
MEAWKSGPLYKALVLKLNISLMNNTKQYFYIFYHLKNHDNISSFKKGKEFSPFFDIKYEPVCVEVNFYLQEEHRLSFIDVVETIPASGCQNILSENLKNT